MLSIKPKHLRQLLEKAVAQGCTIRITKGGHVRIDTPQGVVFCPATASDPRSYMNVRAQLRKKGLDL